MTATTGNGAIEIINNEQIDIILVDVKLQDISGLDVLEHFKRTCQYGEAIVITGFGSQDIAISSLRKGAIDYIEKPIDLASLNAALGRAGERLNERMDLAYKNTLLIVDDDDIMVSRLQRDLKKEGFEVFAALNGKDALKIIEDHKVDILIVDIRMADMQGPEVLQQAKKHYADIEGIMITGFRDDDATVNALRAGAIDYITKPINMDELCFSINKAIERVHLTRNSLYRNRELKISAEIITKMNQELERRIEERTSELDTMQVQLIQTSKLATLGEMSAGLAHEMNQPLAGISLTSTYFRKAHDLKRLNDEDFIDGLDDIDGCVKRMSKIIQHIRTFARQDTLAFENVDINATIDSALSLLNEQLRLHEIQVEKEFAEDLPEIEGEPYQLEQVWINHIGNARDAIDEKLGKIKDGTLENNTDDKQVITIATRYDAITNQIIVAFTDTGMGMTAEVREKIFIPFFTTKEVGKGMGLGMSICYGIINNHKGKIAVVNAPDERTRIEISLPLATSDDDDEHDENETNEDGIDRSAPQLA